VCLALAAVVFTSRLWLAQVWDYALPFIDEWELRLSHSTVPGWRARCGSSISSNHTTNIICSSHGTSILGS
jgi:hypothetical protein